MPFRSACWKHPRFSAPFPFFLLFVFFIVLSGNQEAGAVRPLDAPVATVAGDEYHPGFQDGSFDTALFNVPLGLCLSGDGNLLFVADSGNNRIRVIHLDDNNEVTTLAGGAGGRLDGPLTLALFNTPRGLITLPDDRLVVNDYGNKLLRLVELKDQKVSTLAGGSPGKPGEDISSAGATLSTGPEAQVAMGGIVDMAYLAPANSIYFTQPDSGSLKALNLNSGLVSIVFSNNTQVPHPCALWCQGSTLYVADRDLPMVCEMDWKANGPVTLLPTGLPQAKVISLCSNDNILYGILNEAGFPVERFALDRRYTRDSNASNALVTLRNAWGDSVPPEKYFPNSVQECTPWMSFVPDSSDCRKFYVSDPEACMIYSLRDLFITGGYNSNHLFGPEYPAKKPKNTYRIMLIGDSRTLEAQPYPFTSESHPSLTPPNVPEWDQNLTLIPSIERELNFQAALDDTPLNYEVLNFGRHGDLLFWPTIDVPAVAEHNDVDLVVLFSPNIDYRAFNYYYNHSLTSDGIPLYPPDMEYLLKPPLERIPDGLTRKFYDFCKARNLVHVVGRNLSFDDVVMTLPECHDMILEFYGKPWEVLNRKLSNLRTSGGKPIRFLVLLAYTGREGSQKYQPDFYTEVANQYKIPIYNLNPAMNALHLSYYPLTGDGSHLNPDGCVFFGKLLAHELVKDKIIPWKEDGTK